MNGVVFSVLGVVLLALGAYRQYHFRVCWKHHTISSSQSGLQLGANYQKNYIETAMDQRKAIE